MKPPIIGIDFDNTIVCYDELFYRAAREKKWIPANLPHTKASVKEYLQRHGLEQAWTELQGEVYGMRMNEAVVYPGAVAFFHAALKNKMTLFIISHKTLHPYQGPAYDLHEAAYTWLAANHFFDAAPIGLCRDNVFFELSINKKLQRIKTMRCDYFIDDLPELLSHPHFPAATQKMLFVPGPFASANQKKNIMAFTSWHSLSDYLFTPMQGQGLET